MLLTNSWQMLLWLLNPVYLTLGGHYGAISNYRWEQICSSFILKGSVNVTGVLHAARAISIICFPLCKSRALSPLPSLLPSPCSLPVQRLRLATLATSVPQNLAGPLPLIHLNKNSTHFSILSHELKSSILTSPEDTFLPLNNYNFGGHLYPTFLFLSRTSYCSL